MSRIEQQQPDDGLGPLPGSADVVVIGGGVAGTAAAYQLAKRGQDVVLVEMRGICSGASGRNAGQTGIGGSRLASRDGRAYYAMTTENFRLLSEELPAELGDDFELTITGSVDIAQDEAMWQHLVESLETIGEDVALEAGLQLLDRHELQELIPVASDHLLGAKYSKRSGHHWPFKLVNGLANGTRDHGGAVFPWTTVTEILTANGKVTGVATSRGVIETATVVVATNAWTAGLLPDLPEGALVPARGQIIVTQPVPPVLPMAFGTNYDKEYGRQTPTGQLICGGFRRDDVNEGLGLLTEESHLKCVAGCASCLVTLFPAVSNINVARSWAGPMGFTADGKPLIGRYSQADGLFISAGYNGGGFSLAPVAGRIMADLIVDGETAFDIGPFDPNRFSSGTVDWANPFTAGEKNNPRSMAELQAQT